MHKINKLTKIPLVNLINIRFIEQEEESVCLYYQNVGMRLADVLEDMEIEGIKMLHRQFIDLVIGLAKVGVITEFREECCGAVYENGELVVKYYL